jgi:hypothetical protein
MAPAAMPPPRASATSPRSLPSFLVAGVSYPIRLMNWFRSK